MSAGTTPVMARLLSIEGTGTTLNDSPKLKLEMELPGGKVLIDQTFVPLYLMSQLRPGENVPILLANSGGHFRLDVDTMSRVQPAS